MRTVDDRGYVEKIAYVFISKYRAKNGELPYGVLFNKFMTLVYRRIRDSLGKDIGLSHCWYRWGDEVVRYDMPFISWNHESQGVTRVSYSGHLSYLPHDDDIIVFADRAAEEFISRYHGREGMEEVVDEVYSNAPFQFQNEFRKLRENLKIAKRGIPISNHIPFVRQLFDEAMKSFPYKEFPGMEDKIRGFESIFNRALNRGLSVDRLQDISEDFWFMFCYRLRLHPRCHENVSRETLEIWMEMIPDSEEDYSAELERYAGYLFDEDESDPIIADLHERGKRRLEEIEELLEGMRIDGE